MGWVKSFVEGLERLIDKPPYLIFVFVGAVFAVTSLITNHHFKESWAFFLYSATGMVWRYIEKDMTGPIKDIFKHNAQKKNLDRDNSELWIRSIYHLGNIGLLLGLFFYLSYL